MQNQMSNIKDELAKKLFDIFSACSIVHSSMLFLWAFSIWKISDPFSEVMLSFTWEFTATERW